MNDRALYEHTQTGWPILVAMVVAVGIVEAAAVLTADRLVPWIVVVLVPVTLLFSSLTIRVTPQALEWWLGLRMLGRTIPLAEIGTVEAIRTNLFEGWGIHLTWHGWLWNVSGFNAVSIRLRGGTRYALGTPEPQAVIAAIERARAGG